MQSTAEQIETTGEVVSPEQSKRRRLTPEERAQVYADALGRAVNGQSLRNYAAIFEGCDERGIPEGEVQPRENVFTYNAWRGKGRQVSRGQKGIRISVWVPGASGNEDRPEDYGGGRDGYWRTAHVFHVSQTEEAGSRQAASSPARVFRATIDTE